MLFSQRSVGKETSLNDEILIKGSDDDEDDWNITELSEDHKPDLPKEHERITVKFGGRVLSYLDSKGNPVGPARVWLKNQNIPGLAMSRSIGDTVAHSVGVE